MDAMRFALCSFSTQGRDINLDVLRIHGYRRFCNKIWQAVRLTLQKLGDNYVVPTCDPLAGHPAISPELSIVHAWILSRLSRTIAAVNAGFKVRYFLLAAAQRSAVDLFIYLFIYLFVYVFIYLFFFNS